MTDAAYLSAHVEHTHLAAVEDVTNGVVLGAVVIAVQLAVLEELALGDVDIDLLASREPIRVPVYLVLSLWSRGVCHEIEVVDKFHGVFFWGLLVRILFQH